MPIYEYQCSKCGFEMDELQSMSAPPLTKCPNCGNNTLQKLIGTGGGLIFKGSGFYLTDYKNKSKSEKSAVSTSEKTKSSGDTKGDSSGKEKESKRSSKEETKSAAKEKSGESSKATSTKKESKKS